MVLLATTSRLLPGALWYASQGWKILPCHGIDETGKCTCGGAHTDPKDIGKHPAIGEWQHKATSDPGTIQGWWTTNEAFNIGVVARDSGFFVLDVDPRSGGFDSFAKLTDLIGDDFFAPGTSATNVAITGQYSLKGKLVRGNHYYFRADAGEQLKGKLEGFPGIDIKHNGYLLLNPSRHVSGVEYEWEPGKAPWELAMAEPSEALLSLLRKRAPKTASGSGGGSNWDYINDLDWNGEKLDVEKFFAEGIDEGSRAVDIYALSCALANKFGTDTMGRQAVINTMRAFNFEMVRPPLEEHGQGGLLMHVERALTFVADNPKAALAGKGGSGYTADEMNQIAVDLSPVVAKPTGPQARYTPAPVSTSDEDDSDGIDRDVLTNVTISKDKDALNDEEGGEMGSRTLTDTGNGRRLVDTYGSRLRYTPGLGWFFWTGDYWMPDTEELHTREITKRIASVLVAEGAKQDNPDDQKAVYNWAKQAKSNARQSAAIESATSDPRIGVAVEHWDADPYLLGVANGVVDLRDGQLYQGAPDLHITRRAPIAYRAGTHSQRFQDFLDFATYGDKEFQDWLQRAMGYTLTGLRTYDVMLLMYGPGGSGKNVMVEALVKCLGTKQYAFPLDSMILAQGDGKANASDQYHWAELRGRRMIWVDELPESERLKENSVKKLTGSSEISARSPGEKPFTFESQGKLWVTTNHRPIITDDAMWRRIRPIPWMHVPEDPDPTLKQYLHDPEGGLPAVLSWAVEGAMKLLASKEPDALGWCSVVSEAAEMYRKNEDRMGMFLDEETVEDVVSSTPVKSLFYVYKTWSEDRGERPMTQIAFQRKLADRGEVISGSGGRAMIMQRKMRPQPSGYAPSDNDWGYMQRLARE